MAKNTLTTAFYQTEEALKHPIPVRAYKDRIFRMIFKEKRGRRENAVRCLGSLLGGVHAEYLHPRHGADETRRSGHHRWGHQPADALKKQGQTGKFLSGPVRYFPRLSPCGSACES